MPAHVLYPDRVDAPGNGPTCGLRALREEVKVIREGHVEAYDVASAENTTADRFSCVDIVTHRHQKTTRPVGIEHRGQTAAQGHLRGLSDQLLVAPKITRQIFQSNVHQQMDIRVHEPGNDVL